jgi:hypothetical protein
MDDLFLVDIVQSLAYLSDDWGSIGFLHAMAFPQHLQQLPSCAVFNQEIHILLVLEVPVERSNVAVVEVELNAEFTGNLIHVLFLSYLFLRHDFHATQEACLFVLH